MCYTPTMLSFKARAGAKAIFFGEHAVVYGRPAIGAPIPQLFAEAEVREGSGGATIIANDLDQAWTLAEMADVNPLGHIVRATLRTLEEDTAPNFLLTVHSTIPMARGLGSGTAISTAVVRALAGFYGARITPAQVSSLVFETEMLYHGTPSGVDNTIIAFEQPVYFVRGQPPQRLKTARGFHLVVGDTGVASQTKTAVGDVRAAWEREPDKFNAIFDNIAALVNEARTAIEYGRIEKLGPLMNRNQEYLQAIGVSSLELESLIEVARNAGASGAKLSGGGRGGCMIALVDELGETNVVAALREAGAELVVTAEIPRS